MKLEILQVPGCPGADLLDARLAELGHRLGSSGGSSPARRMPNGWA